MNGNGNDRRPPDLDEFVEAFDRRWSEGGVPEIDQFLPDGNCGCFNEVLVELVRVDVEWRWQRGCPLPLDEYRQAYADVLDDAETFSRVAFEEFRCRTCRPNSFGRFNSERPPATNEATSIHSA